MSSDDVNRREFLSTLGRCAGGACLACGVAVGGSLVEQCSASSPDGVQREVDFYKKLSDRKIQCFVCPQQCTLSDGETCFCRTRTNVGGKLITRAYNNPCILSVDPIEKLPLNHFQPGTKTLTIGVGGCNMRCLYCQNWQQSQKQPGELKTFDVTPEGVVKLARKYKLDTIAMGYTEPVAFLEYAKDVARAARQAGLKVAVGTAAFIEPEPFLDFAQYVDAFAISLKGFDEDFYYRTLGVSMGPVLKAIETLKAKTNCWIELINLVVPTYNDNAEQIRGLSEWVHHNLGDDQPLHFARFVPTYRLENLPSTPVPTLEDARRTAQGVGLRYVYTSNVAPHAGTNTYCHKCGTTLIQRLGFKILENALEDGRCPNCKTAIPGVLS